MLEFDTCDEAHWEVLRAHPKATRQGKANNFIYIKSGLLVARVWRVGVFKWQATIKPKLEEQPRCRTPRRIRKRTN
jgi:hypothetical protein